MHGLKYFVRGNYPTVTIDFYDIFTCESFRRAHHTNHDFIDWFIRFWINHMAVVNRVARHMFKILTLKKVISNLNGILRSEERRVGKECRQRRGGWQG